MSTNLQSTTVPLHLQGSGHSLSSKHFPAPAVTRLSIPKHLNCSTDEVTTRRRSILVGEAQRAPLVSSGRERRSLTSH